ncbi:MAG: trypsin-like peptidase domain-containing protein [Bryobacterales bacterium]
MGDWAIAMGSPFGFRESVTVGIISAKSREVQSSTSRFSRPFQKFFQTDAAINPGNSGGPLLNIRGEVIGINTAIVSRSGAYEGLGFALPSNIAANVYNQIIKKRPCCARFDRNRVPG